MRAASVSAEEQYRLIMECRASGLSDYQWCMEHNIKPGTFYNWVKRLRNTGSRDLPAAARFHKQDRQEVVRIEFGQPDEPYSRTLASEPTTIMHERISTITPTVLELVVSGSTLRIPNGTDPILLEKTLRLRKELSC